MDSDRFDALSRQVSAFDRRQGLRRSLGVLALVVSGLFPSLAAAAGNEKCTEEFKRGQTCEKSCQCVGRLRCGAPRDPEQREDCGEDLDAKKVCCHAPPDACETDCDCCGGVICVAGRCRPGCRQEGACCPGGRCRNGKCVPTYATLADCEGRCSDFGAPQTTTVCGQQVACPDCGDCESLGCADFWVIGTTPKGEATYCVPRTNTRAGTCNAHDFCPAHQICNTAEEQCYRVCTGPQSKAGRHNGPRT